MTGISRRSISTYEMGDAKPKRPTLLSWALATGVSLDWLTSGAQSVTPRPTGGVRARQDSNLQPSDPKVAPGQTSTDQSLKRAAA